MVESFGGGRTVNGGEYAQRYLSIVMNRDGRAFRMREYCSPFQTYAAFGEADWERATGDIMRRCNAPWPASQTADPVTWPPRG